jgi:hypothetical protein
MSKLEHNDHLFNLGARKAIATLKSRFFINEGCREIVGVEISSIDLL